ncbi:unnamed protein product [Rotaria sordida]|uniref:Rab-GAP TBC domain-containing protein n=1 Tax=Rotaria sordida TaxID=392033 RepID=A0A819TJD0_9BILA|nr:unnamed protein product [Rotaria sordida]CAF1120373.1 unnamed protein product [Rotaria sordida]CAF3751566.1 unnamed protein product [Rotaria sordida]CAF4066200.1 unnamed protein product [Rotaria sordida]
MSTNDLELYSSFSLLSTNDECRCHDNDEVRSSNKTKINDRYIQLNIHVSNIVIFIISLHKYNIYQCRKKFSVDTSLLSHKFLVHLINRIFNLNSNFIIKTKNNFVITDDFDVDGCIMNYTDETILELKVDQYDTNNEYSMNENNINDNYDLIEIENDSIIVTIKSISHRQETLLKKATNWFYGTVNTLSNKCLTKKEFHLMLDTTNGRLLNEQLLRQRIYEDGCEESIRSIVWCYLFRVFNETMTNEDKKQYLIKATEQYNEMKQSWQSKKELEIITLENLIQKDVTRTDSSEKFFCNKTNSSRQKLFNILMTYCIYHPEPGYVQGMTDMVAPIFYVIRDEPLVYACFCALMRYMSPLFHLDGIAMNRRLDLLRKTIQAIDLELWHKIKQCDTSNFMFAYRWLLLDCKREFPFKDIFRVFETLWASLSIDQFELNNNNSDTDIDDLSPTSIITRHYLSRISSRTNTILSSCSCSPGLEESLSEYSSIDGCDSGYRDEHSTSLFDLNLNYSKQENIPIIPCIPLEKWLKNFSSIHDENEYSDMFTIFLCVALLEQNRSSIMQMTTFNVDNDDYIGSHFTRLSRKHDAQQALQLARHYHRQYVVFQIRIKRLQLIND